MAESKHYKIEFKKGAEKDLKGIPDTFLKKLIQAIQKLSQNPRPEGSIKLAAREAYRIRIGTYRVIYEIYDETVLIIIVKVAHRKEVYR